MNRPTVSMCQNLVTVTRLGLLALLVLLSGTACSRPVQPPGPFTVVMLPDTQNYSRGKPEGFTAQVEWVKRNRDRENIAFVTHIGDIVQDRNKKPEQWVIADGALSTLDGVVPWGVCLGNHDFDVSGETRKAASFIEHFGPSLFKGVSWYGGASPNGLNSYQLFTAGGIEFIILHLEFDVPDAAIGWAGEVLDRYPGRAAIISTHSYLKGRDGMTRGVNDGKMKAGLNAGEDVWNKLIRSRPQIFMVLCGHVQATVEYYQVSNNDAGNKVLEMLADYQRRPNGGDGWMRLIRIDPAAGQIQVRTYSPLLEKFETDPDSQFTAPFELPAGCGKALAATRG